VAGHVLFARRADGSGCSSLSLPVVARDGLPCPDVNGLLQVKLIAMAVLLGDQMACHVYSCLGVRISHLLAEGFILACHDCFFS